MFTIIIFHSIEMSTGSNKFNNFIEVYYDLIPVIS